MKHLLSAPSGGRTHTGRILSPLSLPLDYGGAMKGLDYTLISCMKASEERGFELVLGGNPRQIPFEIN